MVFSFDFQTEPSSLIISFNIIQFKSARNCLVLKDVKVNLFRNTYLVILKEIVKIVDASSYLLPDCFCAASQVTGSVQDRS